MANIANGSLEISPVDEILCENLKKHIEQFPNEFSYGGEVDVSLSGSELFILFGGRWTCSDAWDVIDDILADESNIMCTALRLAEINGQGRESGLNYSERVRKAVGKTKLQRGQRRQTL